MDTTTKINQTISDIVDKRILIVDDSLACCKSTATCLKNAGFTDVHFLSDPEMAIERIESLQPSMLLLDILMPKISGLEILRHVVAHRRLSDTIVLMLSSAASDYEAQAINQGALAVFSKTDSDDDFIRTITSTFRVASRFGTR